MGSNIASIRLDNRQVKGSKVGIDKKSTGVRLRNVINIPVSTMILIRNKFIFLSLVAPWFPKANDIPAKPTMATEISAIVGKISDGFILFHFLQEIVSRCDVWDKFR